MFSFLLLLLLPAISIQAFMAFQRFGVITFFLHYWFYNEHFAILQILPSIMYCFHQFYLFYAKHRVLSVIYLHLSSNSPFLFSFHCQLPKGGPYLSITNPQLPKEKSSISLPLQVWTHSLLAATHGMGTTSTFLGCFDDAVDSTAFLLNNLWKDPVAWKLKS